MLKLKEMERGKSSGIYRFINSGNIREKNSVFAAIGSDGIDFIPGIGGAIIDDTTLSQCAEKGLELPKF